MKKWLIVAAAALLVGVLGFAGYRIWQRVSALRSALEAPAEEIAVVQRGTLVVAVSGTGNLAPISEVSLAFTTGGRVSEVLVQEGQLVKAGEALVRLEPDDLALQVAQAEESLASAEAQLAQVLALPQPAEVIVARTNLEKAEVALERARAAYDRVSWRPEVGMLPQSLGLEQATLDYEYALANYNLASEGASAADIAAAESSVAQAEIALDQARLRLAQATLTAPMAGTVTAVGIRPGEMAATGQVIVDLSDLEALEVEVKLDETDVAQVALGQGALVRLDAFPQAELTGEVAYVAPIATIQSGVVLYPVTIRLDPSEVPVRAGMTADVDIVTIRREGALIVPLRAVRSVEGESFVLRRVAGGRGGGGDELRQELAALGFEAVQVTLGVVTETEVEITSGLSEGDVVSVVAPPAEGLSGQGPGGPMGGMFRGVH